MTGLIRAEERELTAMTPLLPVPSNPSINRGPIDKHIAIERPNLPPPHRQRAVTGSSQSSAPPLNTPGLAIAASTPAILPEPHNNPSRRAPTSLQARQAPRNDPLAAIPQSPASPAASSPTDPFSRGDYFSIRKKPETSPSRADDRAPPTPGAGILQTPLQTPGGSFMGKLKGLGKKKTTETPMLPVVETQEAEPEDVVSYRMKYYPRALTGPKTGT